MTQIYKNYEQELIAQLTNITKKIQSLSVQPQQKKQMAFIDIKQDLQECERSLKLIQTEVNTFDTQIKFEYTRKIRQYKKDYEQCKKKLYKLEEQYALEKNKQMLMGAQLDQQKSSTHREKLLKQGSMLSDTTYKLKNSVSVMNETLDISNNIEIELVGQSDKMKRNKERLIEMREDIGSSERKIKNMMLRIRKNKMMICVVLGLILILGIVALIVHFRKR